MNIAYSINITIYPVCKIQLTDLAHSVFIKMIKSRNKKYLHPCLEIRSTQSMGRGVYATQNIGQGIILMQIDEKQFFTYEKVFQHPVYGFLTTTDCDDLKFQLSFMIASIARTPLQQLQKVELKSDWKFYKYIKQLPKKFNNLICWTQAQILFLNDKDLQQFIYQKKRLLVKSYNSILNQTRLRLRESVPKDNQISQDQSKHSQIRRGNRRRLVEQPQKTKKNRISCINMDTNESTLREQSQNQSQDSFVQGADFTKLPFDKTYERMLDISFNQVLTYYAAIESRSMYYTTTNDSKSEVGALVPLLQLINYSQDPQCEAISEGRRLLVKSVKQIRKDQEIFMDYKLDSLQTSLVNYGFINIEQNQAMRKLSENQNVLSQLSNEQKIDHQRRNLANRYRKVRSELFQQRDKSRQSDQTFEGIEEILTQV